MVADAPSASPGNGSKPPAVVIIRSNMDTAAELTQLRIDRGWTGEEMDARVGWADRYTGKLERPDAPFGKRGLHISEMFEVWLEALGVCLVLMTKAQAAELGARMPIKRPVISSRDAVSV